MSILLSFLELMLYIAIIIFIAYIILMVVRDWFKFTVDANVIRFGQIIVALLCLIAFVLWISGVLGAGISLPRFLH